MFRKILFATNASAACESGACVAFNLARKYDAHLTVLHVFGVPSRGNTPFVVDLKTGESELTCDADYIAWVREEIRGLYADEIDKTPHCDIECRVGVPHREILRQARIEGVDAIVMGDHTCVDDVEAVRFRNVIGNTLQMVTKHAPCPVFVINRPCETRLWEIKTIVLATDFSRACGCAFHFAAAMARQIKSRLLIFHSVDITPRQFGRLESQSAIEDRIDEARRKIDREYVPDLSDLEHGIHIWEGIPPVELLKFAREFSADLIVMAHHNSDMAGGAIGGMIEQVVLRSRCPVVSVNHPQPESADRLWESAEATE
ncbi:universal stress protein [Desulfatiferula olefinivorans]